MKKVFAGVVLPVVAAAAVIGSGFSIWFFGENEAKVDGEASVEVTNLLRIGELEMKSAGKMVLDQTKEVRTVLANSKTKGMSSVENGNGNLVNNTEATKLDGKTGESGFEARGVYFTKASGDFDGKISYTSPSSNATLGAEKYLDEIGGIAQLKIVTKITFSDENLAKYLTVVKGSEKVNNASKDGLTYTIEWVHGIKEINLPVDGTAGDITFNYADYNGQYSSLYTETDRDADINGEAAVLGTAEPHNTKEYNVLVKDVKDAKVTIETTATIVEVA